MLFRSNTYSLCKRRKKSQKQAKVDVMSAVTGHDAPWFVYLITNFDPTVKTNSFVGVSTDPEVALANQHTSSKIQTTANAWRLELVIGPCPSKHDGEVLRDAWTAKSRGITSRRNTGIKLFADRAAVWQNVRCFDVVQGA